MQNRNQAFRRSLVATAAVFLGILFVQLGLDLYGFTLKHGGKWPSAEQLSWQGVNNAKLVDSLSPIARAYNNILAMLLGMVGLAIPLTANMHTPKLIDLFLRDRVNRWVLAAMAIGAGNVLFVLYVVGPEFAPMWSYRIAVAGALVGWIVLVPYFFYVIRFLDPSNVIHRLRLDAFEIIDRARKEPSQHEHLQRELRERLFQLGTLVMKAIERTDREVAREGIWALKQIGSLHIEAKDHLASSWFEVKRDDFVGMSHYALDMMTKEKTWVESQLLHQLMLCSQRAMVSAPDTLSAITNANRKIAADAHENDDTFVVMQCIRLFNTCLSEALRKKNTRTALDILYQYRRLASDLRGDHDVVLKIGGFFRAYAELAESLGRTFVAQFIAFDLCKIMRRAYRQNDRVGSQLLELLLSLPDEIDGSFDNSRVRAKLLAGGFFRELQKEDNLAKVCEALRGVPDVQLRLAASQIVEVEQRAFWEMTDRAINMEWASPERRTHIQALVTELVGD